MSIHIGPVASGYADLAAATPADIGQPYWIDIERDPLHADVDETNAFSPYAHGGQSVWIASLLRDGTPWGRCEMECCAGARPVTGVWAQIDDYPAFDLQVAFGHGDSSAGFVGPLASRGGMKALGRFGRAFSRGRSLSSVLSGDAGPGAEGDADPLPFVAE